MKRIMIIGCCGGGKSTLARQIHQATELPLIHLDQHYWKPNWVESEKEEWRLKVEELAKGESWIIDGNYGSTMEIRMKRADTVVFLDRGRWVCLYRVLKRTFLNYGKTRPDMKEGCNERFNFPFLHYVFFYHQVKRPPLLKRLARIENGQEVIVLKNDKEVQAFLAHIST